MHAQARPHALLIGAGHAHLHVALTAQQLTAHGIRVTLADPNHFWYSGLATGMLGGAYEPQQDTLDPQPLVEAGGGAFLRDTLVRIDRTRRLAHFASGRSVAYDVISFNVGSRVPAERVAGAGEHAWPIKPISNLHRLRRYLETGFAADRVRDIAVVGGGPSGCEIACNLAELARRHGRSPRIRMITRSSRIVPSFPAGAARFLARWLKQRNVEIHCDSPVRRIEGDRVVTADAELPTQLTVLATGLQPPELMRQLDLRLGRDGGLLVNARLHAPDDGTVFGAGDCIAFEPRPLPRVGVFGVRAAPVLAHNLLAALTGRPLQDFRPQKRYLLILNIGLGQGLAVRGRFWAHGRLCMRLKNHLDQQFLTAHRVAG